ncbi:PAS domain-containing protein [Rhodococcus koreensis]|uniref:PAS domain-containing protein n=1 Tax=Rhodococcus koreensis TaxID=99653 RepID=UPI00367115A7
MARSLIPILVHDQSRLLDVNQTFATLLGYDLPEIAVLHVHQVIHLNDTAIGSPRPFDAHENAPIL